MIEEIVEIICKGCLVYTTCDMPCDIYRDTFDPVYKEMNLIEARINRRLSPAEVKQLAVNNAKRLKEQGEGYEY